MRKVWCLAKMNNYKIINGNSLEVLDTFEENSIDAIITDPPYELGFMGKSWDASGIAYNVELWKKALRVLKPGGYLLAFGGSRTFHRIACAIEDGGFEIRDTIMWLYGSGFPKSLNIGLAIDKKNGVESEVVGTAKSGANSRAYQSEETTTAGEYEIKKANNEWSGWGSCLKPAFEPIIMARKPFKGSLVDNVLKYGVGGLNIDECRIDYNGEVPNIGGRAKHDRGEGYGFKAMGEDCAANTSGRFPANVIHDGSHEATKDFPFTTCSERSEKNNKDTEYTNTYTPPKAMYSANNTYGDEGSASRYFYCAKASSKDRDEGLTIVENKNIHPTVKPMELMQYLIKLVCPKGATILDIFNGSGSTGKAVAFENRERNMDYKYIGIELDPEYCKISEARIDYTANKYKYDILDEIEENRKIGQMTIFDFMEDDDE